MKQGDILHGFKVLASQPLPEIGAVMWRMEYEKNGARLIWMDRDDDNKTFSIGFKTIPQDDTGVFHILEHSVLNGSEKYPVKEPFVELLKSSMATFLNAMTFPDKTMYPVSSRNDQDFLNLVDVYMDAVLHPLSLTDPHAFRQEGWHYELDDEDGELRVNGVVYNEMKGAYASSDRVMASELERMLFPDNCYGRSSGGDPVHIPELTYDDYLASHARFYHPSNSYIFLDGRMDLDTVLAKLDGFLASYERIDPDADIPMQAPVAAGEKAAWYEIGPEEDEANKAILAQGWVVARFDELEKNMALSVLTTALTGTNDSPLTKALLDAGLCEDVSLEVVDGVQQLYALLVLRNADPAKKDEIWALAEKTLAGLADHGLDHGHLASILDRLEFVTREKDFGSMPKGLVYAINAMETWLYGGDPAQNFSYDALFASLREKIGAGWFELFLRRSLLDNGHTARVLMLPSKTLGEEKAKAEADRCARIKAGWDKETVARVMEDFRVLRERQARKDTPEELESLPVLALADIPEERPMPVWEEAKAGDATVLYVPQKTDGITYFDMYFSLDDVPTEELPLASFLTKLLGQTATEHYTALELHSRIEAVLGHFAANGSVAAREAQTAEARTLFQVTSAMLSAKKDEAADLLEEILLRSRFDDTAYIFNLLRQERIGLEQSIIMSGNAYASLRTAASGSARGAAVEALQGVTYLRWLQAVEKSFDTEGPVLCEKLSALAKRLFSRERVLCCLTGERDEAFPEKVLSALGTEPMGPAAARTPFPARKEGFLIPAAIGFACKGANLYNLGGAITGAARVSAKLLTFDYLWNAVRVQGGAYGVNLSLRREGDVLFTSYRDPSPARTLDCFDACGQTLRDTLAKGESVDKYIISTVSDTEPLMTPRTEGVRAAAMFLTGQTGQDLQRERSQILHATREQMAAFAGALDDVCAQERVCVIGGKAVLDACQGLDSVEPIQQ